MAVSEAMHHLTEELFREFAEATWRLRIKQSDNEEMPELPDIDALRVAIIEGDLDEGMPEFNERVAIVEEACDAAELAGADDVHIRMDGRNNLYVVAHGEKTQLPWYLIDRTEKVIIAYGLEDRHRAWAAAAERVSDIKHPIAPLIEQWFKRPLKIKPARKRAGILPSSLRGARVLEYLPGIAPEEAPLGNQGQEAMLLGFASAQDTIVPTAIVQTWARGGGTELTRGRGAPLSKRIFYEVLTELTSNARRIPGRKHIVLTLRDLRDWLYPREDRKRHNFRPQRDIEKIRDALWEVDQMRIKVIPPGDKAPTNWRVIDVRAFPEPHLDSRVEFYIELPPGSSGGALIDRYAMRRYGLVSAPQHSASLGLAYYWDKYGTHNGRRILATRPRVARNQDGSAIGADGQVILDQRQRPVAGFSDDRLIFLDEAGRPIQTSTPAQRRKLAYRERNPAVDRYPVLLGNDLLMLCYPESAAELNSSTTRKARNLRFKRLERAKDALEQMADDGYCVIEPATGDLGEAGYRVMPTGWSEFGLY